MAQLPPGFVLDSPMQSGPLPSPPRPPKDPPEPKTTWSTSTLPDGTPVQVSSEGKVESLPEVKAGAKESGKEAALDSVINQINRVQELYDSGLKDESFSNLFGIGDMFNSPSNAAFDSAGAALGDQGMAAFKVPGQGPQSDADAERFVAANQPRAGDWDSRIEEKLRSLRQRVDANRQAMGLPPAKWSGLADQSTYAPPAVSPGANPPADGSAPPPPPATGPSGGPTPPSFSPGDPQMAANTSGVRNEDDPALAGVREGYAKLLASSPDPAAVVSWLRSKGVTDPEVIRTATEQAAFRLKYPNVPIDEYNFDKIDDRVVPLSGFEKTVTAIGDNPVGAFIAGAGQFLSGNTLDNMSDNPERVRATMDNLSTTNPTANALGHVAGGMLGAGLGEVGLARAGVTNLLARGALADVGMGAANGAGAADGGNRAGGALSGAAYAGAGNLAGNALTKTVRGVAQPAVNALSNAGIPLTIGQTFSQSGKIGAMVKGIEDRATGLPIIGEVINARRRDGVAVFNERAFSKALDPIGGQIQGKIGEEAVAEAQEQVSAAFSRALGGRSAVPDHQFTGQLNGALNQAAQLPRVGSEILDGIVAVLKPYDNQPALTGDMMQQISRELQALKVSYRSDPLSHRINKVVNETDNAILGMFDRQFSGMIPDYNAAREAYRKVSILEDAVLKAKNAEGVFTPAQLGAADRSNTIKYSGKRAAARGEGPFHDYQRDAQTVLPNKVPDSGTAGRVALPLLGAGIIGGDAATGDGVSSTGLTMGAIVAGAYTRAGQRLLTKGARGARPGSPLRKPTVQKLIRSGASSAAVATGLGQ